jgi:hypothetical protein
LDIGYCFNVSKQNYLFPVYHFAIVHPSTALAWPERLASSAGKGPQFHDGSARATKTCAVTREFGVKRLLLQGIKFLRVAVTDLAGGAVFEGWPLDATLFT